jgi:AcrR family transcriptional regulator
MEIPHLDPTTSPLAPEEEPWVLLDAASKRARVLRVAGELFAREGLGVPMPVLAETIGVGVGSIYRQVGRKEDIVAALVVQRFESVAERFEAAADDEDPWAALCRVTLQVVQDATHDHVTNEAWAVSSEHPDVLAARPRTAAALERLVDRARAAGALRADADADDLRLAFRGVKDVEELGEGGALRLAELVLRGISADGTTP